MSPEYVEDYCENHPWVFEAACEDGWEQLETDAHEILGYDTTVEQQGRSGGWCVVRGLPDVEEWDAIALSKWAKFTRYARSLADDVPYQMVQLVYLNVWEPEQIAERNALRRQSNRYLGTRLEMERV